MNPAHRIALAILLALTSLSLSAQSKVAKPLLNPRFVFSDDASTHRKVTSGDTVIMIGEHFPHTGVIVFFRHKYTDELDIEFEFQIYNDKTLQLETGEGISVMLFNDLNIYSSKSPLSGEARGIVPDGAGMSVHFQVNPTREVQFRDGYGKVLMSAPAEDVYTHNTKWAKARVTAKDNMVKCILNGKPVLEKKFALARREDPYPAVVFGAGTTDVSSAAHYIRNVLVYTNPDPVYPYLAPPQIAWDKFGPVADDDEKKKVLPFIPYGNSGYLRMEYASTHLKNIILTDLNKDGRMDFIYKREGSSYSDIPSTLGMDIFLNNGADYSLVFSWAFDFFDAEFSPAGKLKRMIFDSGNQGNIRHLTTVDFLWDDASSKNGLTCKGMTVQLPYRTILPKTFFEKPKYFETINPIYTLRTAPVIDSVYNQKLALKGNVLGFIAKGTRGRALAEATDDTGRVWWFVEILPGYKFYTSAYYKGDVGLGYFGASYKAGWMSSRYVKEL